MAEETTITQFLSRAGSRSASERKTTFSCLSPCMNYDVVSSDFTDEFSTGSGRGTKEIRNRNMAVNRNNVAPLVKTNSLTKNNGIKNYFNVEKYSPGSTKHMGNEKLIKAERDKNAECPICYKKLEKETSILKVLHFQTCLLDISQQEIHSSLKETMNRNTGELEHVEKCIICKKKFSTLFGEQRYLSQPQIDVQGNFGASDGTKRDMDGHDKARHMVICIEKAQVDISKVFRALVKHKYIRLGMAVFYKDNQLIQRKKKDSIEKTVYFSKENYTSTQEDAPLTNEATYVNPCGISELGDVKSPLGLKLERGTNGKSGRPKNGIMQIASKGRCDFQDDFQSDFWKPVKQKSKRESKSGVSSRRRSDKLPLELDEEYQIGLALSASLSVQESGDSSYLELCESGKIGGKSKKMSSSSDIGSRGTRSVFEVLGKQRYKQKIAFQGGKPNKSGTSSEIQVVTELMAPEQGIDYLKQRATALQVFKAGDSMSDSRSELDSDFKVEYNTENVYKKVIVLDDEDNDEDGVGEGVGKGGEMWNGERNMVMNPEPRCRENTDNLFTLASISSDVSNDVLYTPIFKMYKKEKGRKQGKVGDLSVYLERLKCALQRSACETDSHGESDSELDECITAKYSKKLENLLLKYKDELNRAMRRTKRRQMERNTLNNSAVGEQHWCSNDIGSEVNLVEDKRKKPKWTGFYDLDGRENNTNIAEDPDNLKDALFDSVVDSKKSNTGGSCCGSDKTHQKPPHIELSSALLLSQTPPMPSPPPPMPSQTPPMPSPPSPLPSPTPPVSLILPSSPPLAIQELDNVVAAGTHLEPSWNQYNSSYIHRSPSLSNGSNIQNGIQPENSDNKKGQPSTSPKDEPDYLSMTFEQLKKLGADYGLRTNTSKRLLAHQLTKIWRTLNPTHRSVGYYGKQAESHSYQNPHYEKIGSNFTKGNCISSSETKELYNLIENDSELYSNILLYKPISIAQLLDKTKHACKENEKYNKNKISSFLDSQGILFID